MYDPKSKVASEFICHEEIEETLAFAQEHKHNREYIQKALKRRKLLKVLPTVRQPFFWLVRKMT